MLTLYQLTSKTEYNIYILFLVALPITGLTYDTTQQVRVLLQPLATEHMQFTITVQILTFLNTNFSLYSSINESHSGNTKTVREEQIEKWDNCSRQPSRLQNSAAHAYNFFFFSFEEQENMQTLFCWLLKPKLHVITAPGGMAFDDRLYTGSRTGFSYNFPFMWLSLNETLYVHSVTEAFQIRTIQSVSHERLNFLYRKGGNTRMAWKRTGGKCNQFRKMSNLQMKHKF